MWQFITGLIFCFCLSLSGTADGHPLSYWFDSPAEAWDSETLPLGNGSLGANIFGGIGNERITFNEKSFWRGGPNTPGGAEYYWNVNKNSAHLLDDIRDAFLRGDTAKAEELTCNNFNGLAEYEPDRESPFRFGNYTTMGEFNISTGISEENIHDYRRELSLDSALAVVTFRKGDIRYRREYFVSYPDNVLVVRFSTDGARGQELRLVYHPNPESEGRFFIDGGNGLSFKGNLLSNNMKYAVMIRVLADTGAVVRNTYGALSVSGAKEAVFLITADTDYRMNPEPDFDDPETYCGPDPEETTAAWMESASAAGFTVLLQRHYDDYSSLAGRVRLGLNPDIRTDDIPIDERLRRYRNGSPDFYLETLYYQFGRYLLISSSRPGNLPANLQGIWHNGVDGPWRVDYHNNINLQMSYWPACMTGLDECMFPLTDFIGTLVRPGERVAKAYYDADGWTTSVSSNIFGFTSPLSSTAMTWNLCPVAGPWLATQVWDYYDYTRDTSFLARTGYDIIKGGAEFISDYLWKRPDGIYTAAPSTSPEHGPVDQGATFANAVAMEMLADAIDASRVLGKDARKRRKWKKILDNIMPYRIGRYGQLMEWSEDMDDSLDTHRHVNHLFGLHPGHTVSPDTTPELAEAARVVLNCRGDQATGWSMGWKLNQWARLHDGDRSYRLLGNLIKYGTADNLWDICPPFQIDGNFGGVSGMTEMLLQSHEGVVRLLPALPQAWADGYVTGLRARGNLEVDMKWKDGLLCEVRLFSETGGRWQLRYRDMTVHVQLSAGENISFSGTKFM